MSRWATKPPMQVAKMKLEIYKVKFPTKPSRIQDMSRIAADMEEAGDLRLR